MQNYHISAVWATAIVSLAIWELGWKGAALWRAGRRQELGWFIAILIINTAGVLPIVYLTSKDKTK